MPSAVEPVKASRSPRDGTLGTPPRLLPAARARRTVALSRRSMSGEYDIRIITIALRKGYVSRERADELLERPRDTPAIGLAVLQDLIASGDLTVEQAEEVRKEALHETSKLTVAPDAPPPGPATRRSDLPPERVGSYRLLRILGSGGMGIVYEAEHLTLSRRVAIKLLTPHQSQDPRALERFHREARSAANLQHPGIVSVFDVGDQEGLHYYAMELVEGVTLESMLLHGPLDPRRAAELAAEAAEALEYAHAGGIIHRDIKPGNLILSATGRLKIMDFGIAKEQHATTLTASGVMIGTPSYMSPEQAESSSDEIDGRSDVYSLGATLYELVAGKRPFTGDTMEAVLAKLFLQEPSPIRSLVPNCPRDLEVIVQRAMAKEPGLRYQTAQAFADDLRRFLAGEPILARPLTGLDRVVRRVRRHWLLVAGCALAVGLLLGGAAYGWSVLRRRALEEEARNRRLVEAGRLQDEQHEREKRKAEQAEAARRKVQEAVFLKSGALASALTKFEEALAIDPECYEARVERARALKEQARYDDALRDLDAAVALRPRAAEGYVERLRIRVCRREYAQAFADLEAVCAIDPNHPSLAIAAGMLAVQQGNLREALDRLEPAIRRNPKDAAALAGRGGALLALGGPDRREEGWRDVQAAVQLEPANPIALYFMAVFYLQARNLDQAALCANRAIQGDLVFPEAYLLLGKAWLGKANLAAALESLDQSIRFGPNHAEAWLVRALVRLRKGDPANALPDAEHALRLGADAEMARHLKAVALARQGKLEEAGRAVAELETSFPGSLLGAQARVETDLAAGRLDDALALAEEIVRRAPTAPQVLALRGRVHYARKEEAAAADDLKRAVTADPSLFPEIQATTRGR
ncbi:MAG: protein kinase [Planctomycetes bacterium]|nr:protein kinase [Planctomycetota bacterium]